jgi:hypothetical protein
MKPTNGDTQATIATIPQKSFSMMIKNAPSCDELMVHDI